MAGWSVAAWNVILSMPFVEQAAVLRFNTTRDWSRVAKELGVPPDTLVVSVRREAQAAFARKLAELRACKEPYATARDAARDLRRQLGAAVNFCDIVAKVADVPA